MKLSVSHPSPQSLEIDTVRRFPHYAPHDDWYGLLDKYINKLTYTDTSNGLATLSFLMSYNTLCSGSLEMVLAHIW
ncbi:hypothetical protein AciX9_4687 (plasmid) [Granulicella tundricola MP5ACTX9]|uniref:Uncharacterized protein n=1 Tax=Granulicella tundricola (strain ATCC BAA-1859 / DSM 23138 / MP5ACTX9) TaxID=1198114 RepID=E8X832_GRATM|nr:hypothetical protein AciX9_4687 [Granulicella tundricola MP5ACTX9]